MLFMVMTWCGRTGRDTGGVIVMYGYWLGYWYIDTGVRILVERHWCRDTGIEVQV